jgi:hypothetical protein
MATTVAAAAATTTQPQLRTTRSATKQQRCRLRVRRASAAGRTRVRPPALSRTEHDAVPERHWVHFGDIEGAVSPPDDGTARPGTRTTSSVGSESRRGRDELLKAPPPAAIRKFD